MSNINQLFKIRNRTGLARLMRDYWENHDCFMPPEDDDDEGCYVSDVKSFIDDNFYSIDMDNDQTEDGDYSSINLSVRLGTEQNPFFIHIYTGSWEGNTMGNFSDTVDEVWNWISKAKTNYQTLRKYLKPNSLLP